MPRNTDYYSVLGVARGARTEDIKQAYRKLLRQYHPDTHRDDPSAEEKMKQINEAYECLSDKKKRAMYDRYGSMGEELERAGERLRKKGPVRGEDIFLSEDIGFGEACAGVRRKIRYSRTERCARCGGSGYQGGGVCPVCIGSGTVNAEKCLDVQIPAGIGDGQTMQIKALGSCGRGGGENGDLRIKVNVGKSPVFTRSGSDLYADAAVTFAQAALGAEITIPVLEGEDTLKISAGTQNGALYRLEGRGVRLPNGGGAGDLYIRITVEIPENLTLAQREEIKRMDSFMKPCNYNKARNNGRR